MLEGETCYASKIVKIAHQHIIGLLQSDLSSDF
jgi:hypothetical protein